MKWTTQTEYVNTETGEVLGTLPAEHIIIKLIKLPTDHGKTHSIKKIRYLTKPNPQRKLFQ